MRRAGRRRACKLRVRRASPARAGWDSHARGRWFETSRAHSLRLTPDERVPYVRRMPRCARVVLTLLIGAAALHAVPAGAASSIACDSSGLKAHHGTSRNHVRGLKTKGTTCATARKVAKDIAQRLAEIGPGDPYPSKVDGYAVDYPDDCDHDDAHGLDLCSDDQGVAARHSGKRITFTIVYDHFS